MDGDHRQSSPIWDHDLHAEALPATAEELQSASLWGGDHQMLFYRTDRLAMIPLRSSKIYLENGSVAPTSRQREMDTLQTARCTPVVGQLENALVACFTGLLGSRRFVFPDLADRKRFLAEVNEICGRYR